MAFGPIVLMIIGFIALFGIIGINPRGSQGDDAAVVFLIFFAVMMVVASIMSIAGLIMYIIHASKNPRVPEDQRIGWIIGMVMLSGIANVVYFFMYIANEQEYIPPQQNKGPWD
jgi:hypothetical protein